MQLSRRGVRVTPYTKQFFQRMNRPDRDRRNACTYDILSCIGILRMTIDRKRTYRPVLFLSNDPNAYHGTTTYPSIFCTVNLVNG